MTPDAGADLLVGALEDRCRPPRDAEEWDRAGGEIRA